VCFVAVEIVEFEHAIARVLKRKEIEAGRRTTFGTDVAIPSVVLLPASGGRAATVLGHGGCDRGVVATKNIERGSRSNSK
jgi:hypothetical protein